MKNQGFYEYLEEMLISNMLVGVTQADLAHKPHISEGLSPFQGMFLVGREALLHLVIQWSRLAESSTSLITSDGE